MIALSLLSLLLATVAQAAPFTLLASKDHPIQSAYNVPASAVTLPPSFTSMTSDPIIIMLSVGTQNYVCNSDRTYASVGSNAQMFDMSGFYGTPPFATVQNSFYNQWNSSNRNTDPLVNSQYLQSHNISVYGNFDSTQQNGVLTPVWNLTSIGSDGKDTHATIYGQMVKSVPSSDATNVNWVEYNTSTVWANTIYSVNTVGGRPTSNECTPGSNEYVKYAATHYIV